MQGRRPGWAAFLNLLLPERRAKLGPPASSLPSQETNHFCFQADSSRGEADLSPDVAVKSKMSLSPFKLVPPCHSCGRTGNCALCLTDFWRPHRLFWRPHPLWFLHRMWGCRFYPLGQSGSSPLGKYAEPPCREPCPGSYCRLNHLRVFAQGLES